MNNPNPSQSSAAFYTGCADYAPMNISGIITPNSSPGVIKFDRVPKTPAWFRSSGSHSSTSNKGYEEETPSSDTYNMASKTNNKHFRRQLDLGGTRKQEATKRRSASGRNSPQEVGQNGINQPPPVKRALLKTPPLVPAPPSPGEGPSEVNEWDGLSEEIWQKFLDYQQTEEVYQRKMRLRDVLFRSFQESYPFSNLYVVGSSMNGFGCNSSDMDMCLMLTNSEIDQKNQATFVLRQIQKTLRKTNYIEKVELIRAIVPILKFFDNVSGVEVDLNINNAVGIRNTHLLRCYSKMDWRVRPLVLLVKMWAKEQHINDAKMMTISSYSLVLMAIHYLQYGISPPVLPCLHKMYPHKFGAYSDVRTILLNEDLPAYKSHNTSNLGQLLVGFLAYYSNEFNFQSDAISVRIGSKLQKQVVQSQQSFKNTPRQWKCLCIEEPFDLTNTARSVYSEEVFARVKLVFRTSWRRLMDTKQLGSILHGE